MKIFSKKEEKKDGIEFLKENKTIEEFEEFFKETMSVKTVILQFIGIIFTLFLSMLIRLPLISIAHFIRTHELSYGRDIIGLIVFTGFIILIVSLLYLIASPLRKAIQEQLKLRRKGLYKDVLQMIFAIVIVDIFIEPLFAVSNYIASGFSEFYYDWGALMDNIIATILLVIIFSIIYILIQYDKKRVKIIEV